MYTSELLFWLGTELAFLLCFFTAVYLTALLVRQRRRLFLTILPLLILDYLSLQCVGMKLYQEVWPSYAGKAALWFLALPRPVILLLCAGSVTVEYFLLRLARYYEKKQITPMSIKEATDSLPSGLCFYLPGGRVIMQNRAMEDFCYQTTGQFLLNGEEFCQRLFSGRLFPDSHRLVSGENPVILLPDDTVWSVSVRDIPYHQGTARMLMISNTTELYHRTQELREQQKKLEELNDRLLRYNQDLVEVTSKKERLHAKIMIHDTLGANLLSMKRYLLNGGTEEEKRELFGKLQLDISFLKKDEAPAAADEYDLMLSTAEKLGVHVQISGTLPQTEPQKHLLAIAIHECFTNTLRHAHGDTLYLTISEENGLIRAIFTNNGIQPDGEIEEKGGLQSLRLLTNQCGGRMMIRSQPVFSITLEIPKEPNHAI